MPTPTPTPTLADFVNEVRRLAAADPTFIYSKETPNSLCHYYPDERNPHGCIIGAAARNLLPDNNLDGDIYEERTAAAVLTDLLNLPTNPSGDTHRALRWLKHAQDSQDTGSSWSEAVSYADGRVYAPNSNANQETPAS
jgi:hypothetical protein